MVSLDWRVESRAEVSLVELTVENRSDGARRVRVGNRLDGPVWPPRREGVSEAGWDDGGFEGVVAAGDRRALGYASPASPVEPPVELVWTERAGESERPDVDPLVETTGSDEPTLADESTASGVVRSLGDPRPPTDAVPRPDPVSPTSDRSSAVPGPVESWLSAVATGADGECDAALGAEDRAALDAVARRVDDLRERGAIDLRKREPTDLQERDPADPRGSP